MSKIKELLFGYRENVEYWVSIKDIVISYDFQLTYPSRKKFRDKERLFLGKGELGRIELNRDFVLIDGYCSYLICKKYGMDKLPVYFVD